jgi:hypothetical protein
MNNLTKLTEKSRNFILKVSPSKLASLALAKAIANTLQLPTFEVKNKNLHYIEKCSAQATMLLSEVNEMCVFNTRQLEETIKDFWLVRYSVAFPPKLIAPNTNAVFSLLGIQGVLSKDCEEAIASAGPEIITLLNGFMLLLEEIKAIDESIRPQGGA